MKLENCRASEFDELMDFLWECFKTNDPNHPRFETILPHIYWRDDHAMENILILRDSDGSITSSAGVFGIPLVVEGHHLNIPGVGGVCTHPSKRGGGGMSLVMDRIVEIVRAWDAPFAWLGGARLRYERWGWEPAGNSVTASYWGWWSCGKTLGAPEGSVQKFEGGDIPVEEWAALRKPVRHRGGGDAEFLRRLRMKPGLSYRATELPGGRKAFILVRESTVVEFGGDPEGVGKLVGAFSQEKKSPVEVRLTPGMNPYNNILMNAADTWSLAMEGSFAILKLQECLQFAVEELDAVDITDRSVELRMIQFDGDVQSAGISVDNGKVSVGSVRPGAAVLELSDTRMARACPKSI